MKLTLIAIGKARGAYGELAAEYSKRLTGSLTIRELAAPTQKAEGAAILAALPPKAFVVLLDEHGKDLTSRELADKVSAWQGQGVTELVFIIGGADGLTDEVKARSDFTLGLGRKTWPHKMVRVMLIEQLYRAQQINNGHPYHRD
ncbi:MAG: 23S rRNA (pseudouridine(1915)-N(3))-methyltransferase RlmH [Alphaproteobacteria bacterium]|nr:23S rRNA (pseudouridine(1915)-N(3))-methyltransferase RlmH [Alphaproteobacteria bacterium]